MGRRCVAADEPTGEAEDAVTEAVRIAAEDFRSRALTTAGRIAIGRGDRSAAADCARRAVAIAREERAADLLADALELQAAAAEDPGPRTGGSL